MFVRLNAIFNTWGVILHEGRIGGLTDSRKPMVVHLNRLRKYVGENMAPISSTQDGKSKGSPQEQQRRSKRKGEARGNENRLTGLI